MEKMIRRRRELENWDDTTRRRKITLTNPVFIKGLALAPLAIAGTNVNNCIVLCIAVILLLTPSRIVTSLITQRMSVPLKTFFYPLISALIFGPIYYLMYRLIGRPVLTLGVPDRFISQGTVSEQTLECGLDALSIARRIRERLTEIGEAQR